MTKQPLSQYFSLNRRYSRSVNLERDLELPNSVVGYVPTKRAVDALRRFLTVIAGSQLTRAWTLTGVYGTGKSAFAHYLASLCAPETNPMRHYALEIAKNTPYFDSSEYRILAENIPKQGWFRAVATAQREPLSHTIIRALEQGCRIFWKQPHTQPMIARKLVDLATEITFGNTTVDSRMIPGLLQEVATAAKTDILLIIDG